MWYQILAPYFTAGLLISDGTVTAWAPILHWMNGWSYKQVLAYVTKKGWQMVEVIEDKALS